LQIANKIAADL